MFKKAPFKAKNTPFFKFKYNNTCFYDEKDI